MPTSFQDHEVKSRLKNKRRLSSYLKELVQTHRPEVRSVSLSYIFCTDDYLLTINQDFLQHDTLTDIITFDLSTEKNRLEGEIYISVDRVADNAQSLNLPYEQELHRVIFHGVLHLCGLKDKTAEQDKQMRAAEDACLTQYFQNRNPEA